MNLKFLLLPEDDKDLIVWLLSASKEQGVWGLA